MKLAAAIVVTLTLLTQPSKVTPRDLLSDPRPLSNTEIAGVLAASQRAMAGKTFRLSYNGRGQGTEILMGRNGIPRRIRSAGSILGGVVGGVAPGSTEPSRTMTTWRLDYITITDYTGRPARHCNGSADQGDLVVDYRLESSSVSWKVTPRRRDARDFGGPGLAPLFELLQGAGSITSSELKLGAGRLARALVAPWMPLRRSVETEVMQMGDPTPNLRGDPLPGEAMQSLQSLWIDSRTLLPVRWDVSERGGRVSVFDFDYSPLDVRLPPSVRQPDCLP